MLDFDIDALLASKLAGDSRPPDGRLHPSGDLLGSLRHSQLRAAGAPTLDGDIVSGVRMMTGTLWHTYFEDIFRGKPVMTEVKLDQWLPEGWSGTADWIIWNHELQGFVLGDLKTIKGEGIQWVGKEGIKAEHQWQVSSYWWALYNAGLPMADGYLVYYLPQNQVVQRGSFADVKPLTLQGDVIPEEVIFPVMASRWTKTKLYIESLYWGDPCPTDENWIGDADDYVNEYLAPVQDRVQKKLKNRTTGNHDVVLVPHWSAN